MAERPTTHTRLLIETGFLLTVCAIAVAFAWKRFEGPADIGFLPFLLIPGCATLAFLAVGALVPNLVAASKFRWPLMITLPIVYGALLQLCAALWLRGPNPLVRQELISLASEFWQKRIPALGLFGLQVLALSVWACAMGAFAARE